MDKAAGPQALRQTVELTDHFGADNRYIIIQCNHRFLPSADGSTPRGCPEFLSRYRSNRRYPESPPLTSAGRNWFPSSRKSHLCGAFPGGGGPQNNGNKPNPAPPSPGPGKIPSGCWPEIRC